MSFCRSHQLCDVIGALQLPVHVSAALAELGIANTAQLALADIDTILAQPAVAGAGAGAQQSERVERMQLERLFRASLELSAPRHASALDLLTLQLSFERLSSGCAQLDALLDGGLVPGHVVELYGASGCGASLLWHSAALAALLRGSSVVVIDSGNGAFSAARLVALLSAAFGDASELHAEQLLSRMFVHVAVDAFAATRALDQIASARFCDDADAVPWRGDGTAPLGLVVVDSLGALMSPLVSLSTPHAVGQGMLGQVARQLKSIAVENNAVVLAVNYSLHDGMPALGRAWRFVANERLLLERSPGSPHVRATLTRANSALAGHHVEFELTDTGLL
jgi:RecA/RadA recombinase